MPFNSLNFWIVFPFIFSIFWIIPASYRNIKRGFLILVSYLLYLNWNPAYSLILLGITAVTYFGAISVGKINDSYSSNSKRKRIITIIVIITLFPLLIFKYYNFINISISDGLRYIGLNFSLPGLNWMIPVGISFFTFQALGYLWDVYYKKIKAERNWWDYMLFLSFFPQIAAGPISRASDLIPQLKNFKPFNYSQGVAGLRLLLWGMFLKVVIADRLGMYVDVVFPNYQHFSGVNCFIASIFYSLQIYCDFAGYSYMAIGIAKTIGINLINNFNRPYFATSITDFWKRWHISLTRWLTTYIYIPLGGSRCSKAHTYRNIMVTFLVSGIWHGANWTFIIWGAIHGGLLIVERFTGLQKITAKNAFTKGFRISVTFLLVNLAWIFFRMPAVGDAFGMIGHIFTSFYGSILGKMDFTVLFIIILGILILILKEVREEFSVFKFRFLENRTVLLLVYVFIFSLVLSVGVLDSGQFIYVSF